MHRASRSVISGVLAILLPAGTGWAGASCDTTQGEAALRTAALQQYLMVAALTCRKVASYNTFVTSHQSELQDSDRALLRYFVGRSAQTGDGDYNAYKTWLANTASMRSLHDPQFCLIAEAAYSASNDPSKPLLQLVREQPVPIDIADMSCGSGSDVTVAQSQTERQRQASLGNR